MSTLTFDLNLSRVIQAIESSGNPHAIRFESELYNDSKRIISIELHASIAARNVCSSDTARMLAYTSYGLYQLMGFNLYELGWNSDVASFMTDPSSQAIMFNEFLDSKHINYTLAEMLADNAKLLQFSDTYNGSAAYMAKIKEYAVKLGIDPTAVTP